MLCKTRNKIEFNNDLVAILVHAFNRDGADVLASECLNQLFGCCCSLDSLSSFDVDNCLLHWNQPPFYVRVVMRYSR